MKLQIQNLIDSSQRSVDLTKTQYTLGRSAVNDIIIWDERASAQHLDIAVFPDYITVRDGGSVFGTRLNGRPLQSGESYKLNFGDRLEIGSSVITLISDNPNAYYPSQIQPQYQVPPYQALPQYAPQQYYQAPPQYYQAQTRVNWTLPWVPINVAPVPVLNQQEAAALEFQYHNAKKDPTIAYLLWFFLGWAGVHKFYLNRTGEGILYLVLFFSFIGWFVLGILWFLDLFFIPGQTTQENQRLRWEIANRLIWARGYNPPRPY